MNTENYLKQIAIASFAAKEAGKILINNKNKLNITKNSNERDTKLIADITSENLIKDIIKSESDYPILAEESGASSGDMGDTYWVIDPLDGTANYNRDIPICCVSIGMVKNLKPLLGVIYDFNNNDMYIGNSNTKISITSQNKYSIIRPFKIMKYVTITYF